MSDETDETVGPKEVISDSIEKTKATLEDAKEKVLKASRTMREEAAKATDFARERAGVAAETLREGYGRARKDMDKLSEDVTTYVRDNPGRSVLIAAGIGFLIGFLIRSDRRR